MLLRALATVICLLGLPAHAAIVNGEFSSGLTGWSFSSTLKSGASIPTTSPPRINAVGAGDAARAVFTTPSWSGGVFYDEMFQTVTLSSEMAILEYDLTIESTSTDAAAPVGAGSFKDTFLTGIRPSSATAFFLSNLQVTRGLRVSSSSPLAGTGLITFTESTSGGLTTYNVRVDLSDYIGQTVDVFFRNSSANDGLISMISVDNVSLSAPPAVVPLPASLSLLLLGAGSLIAVRRTKAA